MFILKTINPINVVYSLFSNIGIVILGIFGLGIIIFTIYMRIKDLKFRSNGVPVK